MKQYRLDPKLNQAIVDGILHGYKNYLLEKRKKKETMHISSAYAWVRENHIDDQVARFCRSFDYSFRNAMTGTSWKYLQFTNKKQRTMFIVKNERYLQQKNIIPEHEVDPFTGMKVDRKHYLYRLAQINKDVQFSFSEQLVLPLHEDMNLYLELDEKETALDREIKTLMDQFSLFYIVSYELNKQAFISRIRLLIPSPMDGQAYMIEDLTPFISKSSVDFSALHSLTIEQDEGHPSREERLL